MSYKPLRKSSKQMPLIGRGARIAKNVIKSPIYVEENRQDIKKIYKKFDGIAEDLARNGADIRSLSLRIDEISQRLETMIQKQDTIQKQLVMIDKMGHQQNGLNRTAKQTSDNNTGLFANDHLLDIFYTRFEDRFKNTAETKKLHKLYEKLFTDAKVDFNKFPVLDVGCGRGEFLEYMRELKINALGVDINTDMVERAKEQKLKVVQGDALDYLQNIEVRSLGAVTGFHLVEHIPFQALLKLLSATYISLATDGFALFETPNPENILVATNSFYFDPSHLNPLPPELLSFALEVTGFKNISIIRSYPVKIKNDKALETEVFKRFYGPRNYAVIGYK